VKQYSAAATTFTYQPPGPILQKDFTNGYVSKGQIKYYFFPVDFKLMGESLILVNKTQIYGTGENGDVKVFMNIESNILDSSHNKYD
jgi:hypothetical protein